MTRTLTTAQHARLDRLGNERPDAKVIGWHRIGRGPIVRSRVGTQFVNPAGRIKPISRDALQATQEVQ